MATEKLYYVNQYQREFTANVRSCVPSESRCIVTLDRTCFYPEGGGQPSDLGTLGAAQVLDVQEVNGEIFHYCDRPLSGQVTGLIDWERRFDLMQQHSGEHLVSGCVHSRFGYENVGFHMGTDVITIDFSGMLTMEELTEIELAANEAVWADLETELLYPSGEELPALSYRSKKEIMGQIRLVRFPGVDTCACCGTHVRRTGEIGPIKLLSCVKFREGVRVELLCGKRAYRYLSAVTAQNREISGLLSAKPSETAAAVKRLTAELTDTKYALGQLEQQCFSLKAAARKDAGDVLLFEDNLTPDSLRRLTVAIMEVCGGRAAVFSGTDSSGYKYAIGQAGGDLRQLVRQINTALNGRGGGKPFFAQGSVSAAKKEIIAFFQSNGASQQQI